MKKIKYDKNLEPKKIDVIRKDIITNKTLYLMFLPVLAYYIIFCYMPMYGLLMVFQDFRPSKGIMLSNFVGLKHFIAFLTSPSFFDIVKNTFRISAYSILVEFPAPIILALLLNELKSIRYSKIVQNITYLPHFISLVVVCGMLKEFTMDTGIVSQLLSIFGLQPVTMLNQPSHFVSVYIASNIWQQVGWSSIIYLAALSAIDASLIEASVVDGANKWRQIIHITLPSIIPTISIMLILKVGNVLNVGHEKIILLYNDITMEVADVISTYVYRKGLLEQSYSFSTAVNVFSSVVNLILLGLANKASKKLDGSSLW